MNPGTQKRLITAGICPDKQAGFGSRASYTFHLENLLEEVEERGYILWELTRNMADLHYCFKAWHPGFNAFSEWADSPEDAVALALLEIVEGGQG